jgi:DeoR/GlpR family transcriptional regulator of sugar metabolism
MAETRQDNILDWLDRVGTASYQQLADHLKVSTMTVRRAVDDLASRGLAIKTLGGVQRADAPSYLIETAVQGRMGSQRMEKQAIAQAAIQLTSHSQTLFIDGSTTCLEFAKLIARRMRGLTIVTNSALTAMELGRTRNNTVIGIGGEFDPNSSCFVGANAEDMASRLYVDHAFMSTKAFRPAEGTFESAVSNFRVKQILARQSKRVTLLIDHSKFGERALARVLGPDDFHCVVTDEATQPEYIIELERRGVATIVAPLSRGGINVA